MLPGLYLLLEMRSVSRAAERRGVSQPSLSRALARLRGRLGDQLLIRSGAGMVLTPRAEEIRGRLGQWLEEGRDLFVPSAFEPSTVERTFHIGSSDYGMLRVISPALARIAAAAPGIRLVVEPVRRDAENLVSRGIFDMLLTSHALRNGATYSRLLFEDDYLSVARNGHPALGAGGGISLEAFLDAPHVALTIAESALDALLDELPEPARLRVLLQTSELSTARHILAGVDAFMTLPAYAARVLAESGELTLFRPPLPLPGFEYRLAWHARSHRDPATQWLMEQLVGPSATAGATAAPVPSPKTGGEPFPAVAGMGAHDYRSPSETGLAIGK